jgi:excisionase family DNA binding protein
MEQSNILAVSVLEAARRLGVSERTVATLLARNELPSRRIGRRRVIPIKALEEFLKRDHRTGNESERREKPARISPGKSAGAATPTGRPV